MSVGVAIIIPHRDQPDLLADCLSRCVSQTLPAQEIVVVDDGSVRPPDEVVARYGDRVKLIKLPRSLGPAAARNAGFRASSAALIQFLDADDTIRPDKLALQVAAMTDPRVDFVIADWRVVHSIGPFNLPMPKRIMGPRDGLLAETIANRPRYFTVMTTLARRSFLERVGPWREDLAWCEDRDFRYRMLREAKVVAFVDECLFFYRRGMAPSRATSPYLSPGGDRMMNDVEADFLDMVARDLQARRIPLDEARAGLRGLIALTAVRSLNFSPAEKDRAFGLAARAEQILRENGDDGPLSERIEVTPRVRPRWVALLRQLVPGGTWYRLNLSRQYLRSWATSWLQVGVRLVWQRLRRAYQRLRPFAGAVVNYHRVGKTNPYTEKLGITLSVDEFRAQIAYLMHRFEIVPFSCFSRGPRTRRQIAITFDDGYIDVKNVVLPIMEQLGCPFKVFLNAEQVEGRLGWLNRLSFILTRLSADEAAAFAREALPHSLVQFPQKVGEYRRLFEYPTTLEVVDRRFAALHAGMVEPKLFLSSEDLLALRDHPLIEWGSHTFAHLPLDRLPSAERQRQVREGHARLVPILGARLQGFALPFGNAPLRQLELAQLVGEIDRDFVMATHSLFQERKVGDLPEIDRVSGDAGLADLRAKLERFRRAA